MLYRLYTFSASHYCEKARWALDYKGLDFEEIPWVPLLHLFKVKRLKVPKTSVPILQSNEELIQGSSDIIRWLDTKHPSPALISWKANEEARASEIDKQLDRLGVHVRRFIYWHLMPHRQAGVQAMGMQVKGLSKSLLPWIFPLIKTGIFKGLNVNATSVEKSLSRIQEGLQWLEETRDGKPYLLGEKFSLLDISAASLLAPLCSPLEHPIYSQLETPAKAAQALERFHENPSLIWVNNLYQKHRIKKKGRV